MISLISLNCRWQPILNSPHACCCARTICVLPCFRSYPELLCLRIVRPLPVHARTILDLLRVPGMRLSRMCIAESARSVSWRPSTAIADRDSRMANPDLRIAAVIPLDIAPLPPRPVCSPRRRSAARRRRCFRYSDSSRTTASSSRRWYPATNIVCSYSSSLGYEILRSINASNESAFYLYGYFAGSFGDCLILLLASGCLGNLEFSKFNISCGDPDSNLRSPRELKRARLRSNIGCGKFYCSDIFRFKYIFPLVIKIWFPTAYM
jgi:hypothetical protein